MPRVTANGIQIEYEDFGVRGNPVILLIMGLGYQLIAWPEDFCNGLAERGFRVIRFDNRDVGLSEKFDTRGVPNTTLLALLGKLGIRKKVPYTLDDMALDAVGLMDALCISSAHVVGASMGGMIAQILAAKHKNRVNSLTCIVSSSGNPKLPQADKVVMQKLLNKPRPDDKDAWSQYLFEVSMLIASPGTDPNGVREKVKLRMDRSFYPNGTTRQFAAIIESGSRVELLKQIQVPTLVINGSSDRLVPAECGRDIAANVREAKFEVIEGMGHDLPSFLIPRLVSLISDHAKGSQS